MFKKKDGDPKKALMAKSSSTPAPKMLKSGMKGAFSEANSMIGKKMPKSSLSKLKDTAKSIAPTAIIGGSRKGNKPNSTKVKSIPFPVKVRSYDMKTGMKNK
jgi:hypothetical protein